MNKSSYFFGQSVFGQLISLLDFNKIRTISKKHMSDYYVKKFDTSDHLVSMLFSTFANCTSLREVAASMLGLKGKTNHFQLKHIPRGGDLGSHRSPLAALPPTADNR